MGNDTKNRGRSARGLKAPDIDNSRIDLAQSRDDTAHKPTRPPRIPMNRTLNLDFPHIQKDTDNFYYRVIREEGGRIEQAKQAWYEHVVDPSTNDHAVCYKGLYRNFLMRLPIEYWREDQKLKNDRQSATLNKNLGKAGLGENEYIPDGKSHVVEKDNDPLR